MHDVNKHMKISGFFFPLSLLLDPLNGRSRAHEIHYTPFMPVCISDDMIYQLKVEWNWEEKKTLLLSRAKKKSRRRQRRRTDDLPVFVLCRKSFGVRCIVYVAHSRNEHRTKFIFSPQSACVHWIGQLILQPQSKADGFICLFLEKKTGCLLERAPFFVRLDLFYCRHDT